MNEAALYDWIEQSTGFTNARLGAVLVGGNSNVTRLVITDQARLILRHSPANAVSDKASSGIAREYAALSALHGRARVPQPIAWCDDQAIAGVPFSLTGWVDGESFTDQLPDRSDDDLVNRLGRNLIGALADVHRVEPAGLFPDSFGRPAGFIPRQINRWRRVRDSDRVRSLPELNQIADWLLANEPEALAPRIIHCDYHLDNCLADPSSGAINAIIDWEMSTLGDPRIDLGLALFFWKRDSSAPLGLPRIQAISNQSSAIDRAGLAEAWSSSSGMESKKLPYFMVFSAWRLAAIIEGAWVLFRQGKVDTPYARNLDHDVPALLTEAAAIIDRDAP